VRTTSRSKRQSVDSKSLKMFRMSLDKGTAKMYSLELLLLFLSSLYFLTPLRCQPMVLCHPRWQPTQELTEFAVGWGAAGFEAGTSAPQSGALPFRNLACLSSIQLHFRYRICIFQLNNRFVRSQTLLRKS
jgi:hypothetical protein